MIASASPSQQLWRVEFLIASEALADMLNPELEGIDPETAVEVFIEFESDIHRIAQREFVKHLSGDSSASGVASLAGPRYLIGRTRDHC